MHHEADPVPTAGTAGEATADQAPDQEARLYLVWGQGAERLSATEDGGGPPGLAGPLRVRSQDLGAAPLTAKPPDTPHDRSPHAG